MTQRRLPGAVEPTRRRWETAATHLPTPSKEWSITVLRSLYFITSFEGQEDEQGY
jgi:hypothetical protein